MADATARRVRAGAATAVAQVLVMAGSSLLGLLVARRLGSSGATDGFFAANAVYGIALFTAQSLRTTAPASLIDSPRDALARHLRAVGAIAVATLALFAVVALAADALVSGAAVSSLRTALAILAPAAVAHLVAGLLAARCAVLGRFGLPAGAYACGTLVMAASFVVLVDPVGVDAIALSVAIGALVSAAAMVVTWAACERRAAEAAPASPVGSEDRRHTRTEERGPREPRPGDARTVGRLVGHLLRGAVPVLASQAAITVSVFAAAHLGAGDGTLYSYGMLAVAVLVAIVASPVSIVLAPDVARDWDRDPASLVPSTLASYRVGALALPVLAIPLLLAGPAAAEWVLTALSVGDVERVFAVAAILTVSVPAVVLSMVPLVGSVAAGLLGRVGVGSVAVVLVHTVAAATVTAADSIALLAVEGTLAAIALASVPVVVALRRAARPLARAVARATVRNLLPGVAVATVAWLALGAGTDLGPNLIAAAAGLAAHAAAAVALARDDLRALLPSLVPAALWPRGRSAS